ncbi:Phosphoglucosamine mutase [bioreactor metagenome]|uniref:Phosphoglucosamine mutase n=1 Tax=bioreactor metagenome TaxID=1076179 RepID=A0A645GJY7_9ZZZZ
MIALAYSKEKKLASDTVVVTSMSNLGLTQAMKKTGIKVEITDVGDRYVIERMRAGGFNVGGEQSGHIIFTDYATTGDGILSALHVLKLVKETGLPLAELAGFMTVFPQKLNSFAVARKIPLTELTHLPAEVEACRAALGESGRTVVRYSGTENKIRILVEAEKAEDVETWIGRLTAAANRELN